MLLAFSDIVYNYYYNREPKGNIVTNDSDFVFYVQYQVRTEAEFDPQSQPVDAAHCCSRTLLRGGGVWGLGDRVWSRKRG